MDTLRLLDILGFVVGLVYLWLEYKASIWLWLASIVMPLIDLFLYYKAGLYADFGMAIYYVLAGIYGFIAWKWFKPAGNGTGHGSERGSGQGSEQASVQGSEQASVEACEPASVRGSGQASERPITHFKRSQVLPALAVTLLLWAGIWWILVTFTNSTVPVADAFTTALSIVALWALSQKYAEQWLLWLAVDLVCTILYVRKGIPFKAAIYGLYTVIAVFGYRKWLQQIPV